MLISSFSTRYRELGADAKLLQLRSTLCDPRDGSPPGFPVPGILQARTLEWVAISFSDAWKWKVKVKSLSHVQLLETPWTATYQAPLSMDFPGKSAGVGCHCLLRSRTLLFIYSLHNGLQPLIPIPLRPPPLAPTSLFSSSFESGSVS